ncbi:hypothetical protein AB0J86_09570 [Micromonospora sp. NPDC049559]
MATDPVRVLGKMERLTVRVEENVVITAASGSAPSYRARPHRVLA